MTPRTVTEEAVADRPRLRAAHLAIALVGAGLVVFVQMIGFSAPVLGPSVPWWAVAAGFAVAQASSIHLRVRRDAHRISLSEIPLVFGLAGLGMVHLLGARLLGEAAGLVLVRRQRGEKLAFNLGLVFLETSVVASVYRGVLLGADPASPQGWLAALAGCIASLAVGASALTAVIRLHDPDREIDEIARSLSVGLVISVVSTVVGIMALVLVTAEPWSVVMLIAIGGALLSGLRVFEALFRRHHDLESVHDFAESVGSSLDVDVVIHTTLTEARRVFHASDAVLVWREGDGYRLLHAREDGAVGEFAEHPSRAAALVEAAADHSAAWTLRSGPVAVADFAQTMGIDIGLAAALTSGTEALGILVVGNRAGGLLEFDADDVQLLTTVASQAVVALERGRLLERVRRQVAEREHRALHDSLTGLPNRVAFAKAIETALAGNDSGRLLAVALLDLDRFKEINDTLGHQHGDIVLSEVAGRLRQRVRDADVVARLGGDEFGILVSGLRTASAAVSWTHRIAEALVDPLEYDGLSLVITGSVGVAMAPEHGTDAATLMRRADVAMYSAKRRGSRVEVYQPEHDPHSTKRLTIIGELGPAIEAGQLVVYYQPKVRLTDGAVVGMEALVRWQHPRLGLLPPPDFVELAETTGLIGPLTRFVLETAVTDLAKLNADGHDMAVSVNVAPRCFADGGLPETVDRVLDELGVAPGLLTLEITETAAVADSSASIATLDLLAEMGVRLSVDDFGTGYASLAYLTSLPVHELKIDRGFVGTMDTVARNARIVESSIGLARGVGLSVVAEGVETNGAWEMLKGFGCDTAQGFLLGRPVPIGRLREWLETFTPPGEGAA